MSAFVVGREHIAYLVAAATQGGRGVGHCGLIPFEDSSKVGQMLWDENIASVRYRYPDCTDELPGPIGETFEYSHRYQHRRCDPVQTLKAISCLEYQSCEHPGWEDSEARKFCERLRHHAIGQLAGYEEASWEIS
jgi:hypothetical protein